MRAAMAMVLAALLIALLPTSATAGGTIPLSEVMQQLEHAEGLIAEIEAELEAQQLEADDITCTGARFGNQWQHLGGARAIPYECPIGNRTLHIEGELNLYDEDDNPLDMDDPSAPERATRYTETALQWSWNDE